LAKSGYIRVILTTNFDRLLEIALSDTPPSMISTSDQVDGAIPLAHSRLTVVKLHGDYLDTRIRNTVTELSAYDERTERLLDRVLDEYGLIVCGWSAEWDVALRRAIERCPSRRYATYWAVHNGALTDAAQRLVFHRGAEVISITDADAFFVALESKVTAIEDLSQPHPLSPTLAASETKRLLRDQRDHIALEDFVTAETEAAYRSLERTLKSEERGTAVAVERMGAAMAILQAILMTIAAHGERTHWSLLTRALERISDFAANVDLNISRRRYPVLRLMYATGVVAAAKKRYETLAAILVHPCVTQQREKRPITSAIYSAVVLQPAEARQLPEGNKRYTPLSEFLFFDLREGARSFVSRDFDYAEGFNLFEFLLAIEHAGNRREDNRWAPIGRFGWQPAWKNRFEAEISPTLNSGAADQWEVARAGFAQSSGKRFAELRLVVWEYANRLEYSMGE
jgi:hypothetical protein